MSESEKARIRVEVPKSEHKNLRSLAGSNGMSMSAYCTAVILEAVRKQYMISTPKKGK